MFVEFTWKLSDKKYELIRSVCSDVMLLKLHMMTSSHGNIFRVTGLLCGEFSGHRWIPRTQRPDTRSFDIFFDILLNKRLSKKPWGWWFETPSRSLWRQCNVPYLPGISHEIFSSWMVAILTGTRVFRPPSILKPPSQATRKCLIPLRNLEGGRLNRTHQSTIFHRAIYS